MFEGVEAASVYAGAFLCGLVPGFLAGQVARPEGPGPALVWADGVNRTFPLAVCELEEPAISGERLLDYCCTHTDAPEVFPAELSEGYFEELGDELNFRAGDPDVAGTGAGAASATAEAIKVQAGGIPRNFLFNHGFHGFTRILKMLISHKKA